MKHLFFPGCFFLQKTARIIVISTMQILRENVRLTSSSVDNEGSPRNIIVLLSCSLFRSFRSVSL